MLPKKPKPIQSLSVRHASFSGGDQVRYLVYRNANEHVAVIAESALLAIRISGIQAPHKVVRDVPAAQTALETADLTIEARHFLPKDPHEDAAALAITAREEIALEALFEPVPLKALHEKKTPSASIIPPETALQWLDIPEHAATLTAPVPVPEPEVVAEPALPGPEEEAPLSPEEVAKLLGE
jgi:hypothetical protein